MKALPRDVDDAQPQRRREVLRASIAVAVWCSACVLAWRLAPDHLAAPIDVVGYPTFRNFAYGRSFLAYRLLVWGLPVVGVLVYWVSGRWGPLTDRSPRRASAARSSGSRAASAAPVEDDRGGSRRRLVRLLPVALVMALVTSGGPRGPGQHVDGVGLVWGCFYVIVVVLLTVGLTSLTRRRSWRHGGTFGDSLSAVNAWGGLVVVATAVFLFSRHTAVVAADGRTRAWPWIPPSLWAFSLLAATALVVLSLLRGSEPRVVERRVTYWGIGSVLVLLVTAQLPGAAVIFEGFDSAQSVVGADLLGRGYFPWRDFLFIHGVFEDALRSSAGFGLFEHSVWGTEAALGVIWVPLIWMGYYLLGVWAAPRRWIAVVSVVLVIAAISQVVAPTVRWVGIGYVLLLLGEALRRDRLRWTVLLTGVLFVDAVVVPEASLQVVSVGVVLVACDLSRRPPGSSFWTAARRTRAFVLSGVALTTCWAITLAAFGALGSFVDYYLLFGPNHNATGAVPLTSVSPGFSGLFILSSLLVALTLVVLAWRLLADHRLGVVQWVMVSSAVLAGLYGEKALGRFDDAHVIQALTVAAPLWCLLLTQGVALVQGRALDITGRRLPTPSAAWSRRRTAVCAVGVTLVLVCVPFGVRGIWLAPGNDTAAVPTLSTSALLGYAYPDVPEPLLVSDLRTAIETYAGPRGRVFDFTNSPGYVYYLLQRDLPTTYPNVSLAATGPAQRMVVEQLRKSQPPVVVFTADSIGLTSWDGLQNSVRHFVIAQYLLDGWTPVLRTHGVLLLLRNDLARALPVAPRLRERPETTGLYLGSTTCNWGDSANFLQSPPHGHTVTLALGPARPTRRIDVSGWAYDEELASPATRFLLTIGDVVVGSAEPTTTRPDAAGELRTARALYSGFAMSTDTRRRGKPRIYAVTADGAAHRIGGSTADVPHELRTAQGATVPVSRERVKGSLDFLSATPSSVRTARVPSSVDLRSMALARLVAPSSIGNAQVSLSDGSGDPRAVHQSITAEVLPLAGSSLSIRVGSCLQWHGYRGKRLYLTQSGGTPIDQIQLSGIGSG